MEGNMSGAGSLAADGRLAERSQLAGLARDFEGDCTVHALVGNREKRPDGSNTTWCGITLGGFPGLISEPTSRVTKSTTSPSPPSSERGSTASVEVTWFATISHRLLVIDSQMHRVFALRGLPVDQREQAVL